MTSDRVDLMSAGGDNVTMGYFKQPEKTKEEFFESDGRRWFRTGDIGLIYPNGTIKIVGTSPAILAEENR